MIHRCSERVALIGLHATEARLWVSAQLPSWQLCRPNVEHTPYPRVSEITDKAIATSQPDNGEDAGVRIEDTPPYARNNVSSVWVGASLNTDGGATVSGAEITLLVRKFATEEAYFVRIWAIAALLILVVSRVILRAFVDHADEHDDCVFPTERWATPLR